MTLRNRLLLSFVALMVAALGVNYIVMLNVARRQSQDELKARAMSLAEILSVTGYYATKVEIVADDIIGRQMLAQAVLTAHLVDVAENRARMTTAELTAVLKRIAADSVIDEFWVTDEKGHAYLHSVDGIDFTFPPEGTKDNQAAEFTPLLRDRQLRVVQYPRERVYDKKVFKYVGVSGVDKPRIVEVGAEAETLSKLISGIEPTALVRSLVGKGGIMGAEVLRHDGVPEMTIISGGVSKVTLHKARSLLERQVKTETVQLTADAYMEGNCMAVLSPVMLYDKRYALLIYFDMTGANAAIHRATIMMSGIAALICLAGFLMALRISGGIASPIQQLARETEEIGKGQFDRRVSVRGTKEVQLLGDAFNQMTVALRKYIEDLQQATAAKERLESEVKIAAEVQESMLPRVLPRSSGVSIAASMQPAKVVGGDFYDAAALTGGRMGISVGDVSGKGLPAALFAAQSVSLMRIVAKEDVRLDKIMDLGNKMVLLSNETHGFFITMCAAVVDPAAGKIEIANAGHPPPVLVRAGQPPSFLCDATGPVLGLMEGVTFETRTFDLQPGDAIVFYTDGVTEAATAEKELFGDDRLLACLTGCEKMSAEEIIARVHRAATDFAHTDEPSDDLTLLAVKMG
jgi:sigma-B regulation protein RsbU (phosphoserine phosphatase)